MDNWTPCDFSDRDVRKWRRRIEKQIFAGIWQETFSQFLEILNFRLKFWIAWKSLDKSKTLSAVTMYWFFETFKDTPLVTAFHSLPSICE